MGAFVEIMRGPIRDRIGIETDVVSLGRTPSNTIVLTDPSVSRAHALIERLADGIWRLTDLGSSNGTFVAGERLTGSRALHDGDKIALGSVNLNFFANSDDPSVGMTGAVDPPPITTERERSVLVALCQGKPGALYRDPPSVADIALSLHISEDAVKKHLSRLYSKFGLHEGSDRRAALANEAVRRGAVSLADVPN